ESEIIDLSNNIYQGIDSIMLTTSYGFTKNKNNNLMFNNNSDENSIMNININNSPNILKNSVQNNVNQMNQSYNHDDPVSKLLHLKNMSNRPNLEESIIGVRKIKSYDPLAALRMLNNILKESENNLDYH